MKQTTQSEIRRELENSWKFMAPYKPEAVAARVIHIAKQETHELNERIKKLELALEREKMKLAACGLAATGDMEIEGNSHHINSHGSNSLERVMILRRRYDRIARKK